MHADRWVIVAATAALAAGVCAWMGWPGPLAVAVMLMLTSAAAVGWGRSMGRGVIVGGLALSFVVFAALALAMVALEAPEGAGEQWLGYPRATSLLVYGLWPLGLLPGALYVWRFHTDVLPEDRLEAFLKRYSKQR